MDQQTLGFRLPPGTVYILIAVVPNPGPELNILFKESTGCLSHTRDSLHFLFGQYKVFSLALELTFLFSEYQVFSPAPELNLLFSEYQVSNPDSELTFLFSEYQLFSPVP